jgi:hypothetical protein
MTDRSFQHANDDSRARLARLVETLTPDLLAVDLGEGWTVASGLAHTGFWDRWQAARWTEMLAGEWSAQDESVLAAEHLANEALHPYWAGVDAADVPALALDAAVHLDELIASAPDTLVDALEGTPSAYMLHRHRHRNDHIDHIERSITAARTPASRLDRSFLERNAKATARLAALVARLTPADLGRSTAPSEEGSWTIAQVLGHLAFWDRSMETRWRLALEAAGPHGPLTPFGIPEGLIEAINRPLAFLIDSWSDNLGLEVGREAVAAAESMDALLAALADRVAPDLPASRPSAVNRWMHRNGHVGSIEAVLPGAHSSNQRGDRS